MHFVDGSGTEWTVEEIPSPEVTRTVSLEFHDPVTGRRRAAREVPRGYSVNPETLREALGRSHWVAGPRDAAAPG